jgi:hypothetical protein
VPVTAAQLVLIWRDSETCVCDGGRRQMRLEQHRFAGDQYRLPANQIDHFAQSGHQAVVVGADPGHGFEVDRQIAVARGGLLQDGDEIAHRREAPPDQDGAAAEQQQIEQHCAQQAGQAQRRCAAGHQPMVEQRRRRNGRRHGDCGAPSGQVIDRAKRSGDGLRHQRSSQTNPGE